MSAFAVTGANAVANHSASVAPKKTGLFTGLVLVAASLVHLVRLLRWRGTRTTQEPILLVLHIGYLWLVVSLALLGLSAFTPSHFAPSTALHALTAGAIGTMTLAVNTRASLGHTGREIKANRATLAIYALVNVGALLRVAAPLLPGGYFNMLTLSGIVGSAAFGLFVLSYGPILLRPGARPHPKRIPLHAMRYGGHMDCAREAHYIAMRK